MKETTHAALEAARNPLVRAAQGWNRFWFQPADPTMLGLIRILCGVLTLYVHLAYSYDLHEFFGRDAWLSLERANLERKETPRAAPSSGWYSRTPSLPMPPDLEARGHLLDFIKEVLDDADPAARNLVVGYLWQPGLPPDPKAWGNHVPPAFFLSLPPDPINTTPANLRGRGLVASFITQLSKESPADQERIIKYMKEWGLDPRQLEGTGGVYWSIWYHVSDPGWMVFVHCLILLVMFLFTIGFCTRITAVLTWLAALSYLQRSPMTLFGGDTMMNLLLIYLIIGPSGAALSVDRLITHWWRKRQALRAGLPEPEWKPPQPMVSANFALRLLQVHFCIIYFAAGTSKLLGGYWWNGQAIYYTMANYEFSPMRYGYYRTLMRYLSQNRWLWEIVMGAGSYFTLFLELGLPFLVWNRRLRPYFVAGSFLLHTAIALSLGLVTFSLFMATIVLAFVPGQSVQRLLGKFQRQAVKATPVIEEEQPQPAEEPRPRKDKGTAAASTHVKAKD